MQIEKEIRKDEDERGAMKRRNTLVQRYQTLEKELYKLNETEKHSKWAQWIKKLNTLDYTKATRRFYKEIRTKCEEEEHVGPIING